MKKLISIFSLFLAVFLVFGCKKTDATTITNTTTTSKTTQSSTTHPSDGSIDYPYSPKDVCNILDDYDDNTYSENKVYVKGYVSDEPSLNEYYHSYTFNMSATLLMSIKVFSGQAEDNVSVHRNDEVLVYGYLSVYKGTSTTSTREYELSGDSKSNLDYPVIVSVTHRTSSCDIVKKIVDENNEVSTNAIVSLIDEQEDYNCGDLVKFSVTPNTDYHITNVKVNDTNLTIDNNEYSFYAYPTSTITVQVISDSYKLDKLELTSDSLNLLSKYDTYESNFDTINLLAYYMYGDGYIRFKKDGSKLSKLYNKTALTSKITKIEINYPIEKVTKDKSNALTISFGTADNKTVETQYLSVITNTTKYEFTPSGDYTYFSITQGSSNTNVSYIESIIIYLDGE